MGRISIICIVIFWSWSTIGQEKTPFATYDFSSDLGYLEKTFDFRERIQHQRGL